MPRKSKTTSTADKIGEPAGSGSSQNSFVGIEFEEGLDSIRWISKNCGCKAELAQMEAYARLQQQDAPQVQKFLAALAAMKDQR